MSNRGMTKKFLISEMDRSVKRMLKLIQEEGDSFAKKAEIYYQKRPILVSQVQDFYRMFRSLAERLDNPIPSDIQPQRASISDVYSQPPSTIPSPDQWLTRRLSTGFDLGFREGDETYTFDSDSDFDDSFLNRYSSGNARRLRKKIAELEAELKRLQTEQAEILDGSSSEIAYYKEELRLAKENIQSSEEEISKLRLELKKYELTRPQPQPQPINLSDEEESSNHTNRIIALEENLIGAEEEVKRLRLDLESNSPKPEKQTLDDKIKEFDSRFRCLEDDLRTITIQKTEMEDEIQQLKAERDEIVEKMSEVEEEMSLKDDQMEQMNERLQKLQLENQKASKSVEELSRRGRELEMAIEKQQAVIEEGAEEKRQAVRQLRITLEHYRNAYQMLRQDLLEQKKPVMAS